MPGAATVHGLTYVSTDHQPVATYPQRRFEAATRLLRLPHHQPRARPRADATNLHRPRRPDLVRAVLALAQVEVSQRHAARGVRAHQVLRLSGGCRHRDTPFCVRRPEHSSRCPSSSIN
jgi:hypothetical protein